MKIKSKLWLIALFSIIAVVSFSLTTCNEGTSRGGGGGGGGSTTTTVTVIPYIITGSGTTFTATKSGVTIGTANQAIDNVIYAIADDAGDGASYAIQFGSGGSELDIGDSTMFFYCGGTITLSGKITISDWGNAIYLDFGTSIISTADIKHTGLRGAITNASDGTVTIKGGTVSAAYDTIRNEDTGTVNISGGTVSATDGNAIFILSSGTVNISGGTVSATSSATIYNNSDGTVNISGGTVSNTSTIFASVQNRDTGPVNISGGTVSATTGSAVENWFGPVNISGGTVSATTGIAILNISNSKITISQASGKTTLITSANTTTDEGTIVLWGGSGHVLQMSGGTVRNTSTDSAVRNAIYNEDNGEIIINGGTVRTFSSTGNYAINNIGGGALTTTGATITGNINNP